MGVYTAIFSTSGDTAALERTDRRYLWLRKRLASRQEVKGGGGGNIAWAEEKFHPAV